jgi:DNA-binding transcriptional regulator YdaS (Cro superfamily)
MNAALKEAVKRAGGIAKLAKHLGIRHQAFYSWKEIPARHIVAIEQATGVPREQLRPDLYRLS